MKVNCPTCQTEVEWKPESRFRPFCSKRCQLIDLGEWADEEHNISTPLSAVNGLSMDPEDIEAMLLEQEQKQQKQ